MNTTAKTIGNAGELLARQYLTGLGYAIIDKNVIVGTTEIDILAQHSTRLIAVEVKTRRADHWDDNFALDRQKIRRLCSAAASYVKTHRLPLEIQIDAILITNHPDGTHTLEHLPDIALPPRRTHHR